MRFFLDNCLAPQYAKALNALSEPDGHRVAHFAEVFPRRNIPDDEWLPKLSEMGDWIVISGDLRIFKSPQLRQVWVESRLTAFFLGKGWMNQPFWLQSWWLVRWWPQVIAAAASHERGSGFEIPAKPSGKFRQLRP